MTDILRTLRRRSHDDRGAGLLEYLFLVALIALVCITAITYFGKEGATSAKTSCESISAAQGDDAGNCG
jgi:Flp pilus assembly pilin Flp